MYALAWLYAPMSSDQVMGSHGSMDVSENEKERRRIMNELYENEGLKDSNDTVEFENDDEETIATGKYTEVEMHDTARLKDDTGLHRRANKSSHEDKQASEKKDLWNSIVESVEDDGDGSDDSDEDYRV